MQPNTVPMTSTGGRGGPGPNRAASGDGRNVSSSPSTIVDGDWNAATSTTPRTTAAGSRGPGSIATSDDGRLPSLLVDDKSLVFPHKDIERGDADAADAAATAQQQRHAAEEREKDETFPPSSVTLLDPAHLVAVSRLLLAPNQTSFADHAAVTPEPEDMPTTYFAAQEPLIETSENPKDPENVGWARSPTEARRTRCSPCRGLRVLLVLMGHAVLVWVVLVAVKGGRSRQSGKTRGQLGQPTHHDAGGLQQWFTDPTQLSSPQHNHPFRCNPEHVQSSTAEFEEPGTFEVREALQLHQGRRRGYHHVSGHINLIPGAADQVPQLIVNTTVWSSWPQTLDRRIATKTTDTALRLQLVSSGPPGEDDGDEDGDDDDDDDDDDEQECTFIRLNIAVAPNTTLSTLSIRSTHLSLSFYPDLAPAHLLVTNTTSIRLSRGAVAARAASSVPPARNTSIELASGAIAGVFPLVDLLCLSTQSGAVRASVVPYASSPLNRSSSSSSIPPAVLDASTQAGDLHVTFSAADGGAVPPRTYVTRARTASGALGGRFLLGQQTRLQSAVGALKAEILPVYSPRAVEGAGEDEEEEEEEEEDYAHTLSTSTNAGSSQIRVLSPVAVSHPSSSPPPAHPPLTITTTHTSRTGFLRAVYPPAWRGAVCAVARIGHVKLGGEGVRVTRRERLGWVGSRVCGVKGDGVGGGAEEDGVDVQLSVQTGDVEFWVSSDGEGNEQGREWGDDGGEDAEL